MDYKKEIPNYLDEVLERKEFSIDRIRREIKNSKYVCAFGLGVVSSAIISAIRKTTDIKIDFLSYKDQTKLRKTFQQFLEKDFKNIFMVTECRLFNDGYFKNKLKLAICIYHDFRHLWEIPLYIKELVPEYKIYLRHHTDLAYETVCYAMI